MPEDSFFPNVSGEYLFPILLCVGSHSSGVVILLCVGNEIISALQIFQGTLCLNETSEPLLSHIIASLFIGFVCFPVIN